MRLTCTRAKFVGYLLPRVDTVDAVAELIFSDIAVDMVRATPAREVSSIDDKALKCANSVPTVARMTICLVTVLALEKRHLQLQLSPLGAACWEPETQDEEQGHTAMSR